jgi:cysteine desulfurase
MQKRIYFDNAATTNVDPRVLESMIPYFTEFYGNASSMHAFGATAKVVLSNARKTLADSIHSQPEEIIFTSSGTEANNLALKGIALANRQRGMHIIVSAIEHDCILNTCRWLATQGFSISYLPVNSEGIVITGLLEKMIRKDTIMVSVMHVNNEIGTIQPVSAIGSICRENKVLFHTDACQSFGKIPINVAEQNIDLMTVNAHKIYGPKGIGALYVRKGLTIAPMLHGGGQEEGIRPSTENIPAIAGFSAAAEISINEMQSEHKRISELQENLFSSLNNVYNDFYLNGHRSKRLPHNLNFSFRGKEGEAIRLLLLLDESGIAVSAGSACSSNDKSNNASHVLQAIGLNQFEARGAIRVSFGRFNTMDEVRTFTETIGNIVGQLNSIYS